MSTTAFAPNSTSAPKTSGQVITSSANNLNGFNTTAGLWLSSGAVDCIDYSTLTLMVTFTGNDAATAGVQIYMETSDDGVTWYEEVEEDGAGVTTFDELAPRYRRCAGTNGNTNRYQINIPVIASYFRISAQERGDCANGGTLDIAYVMGSA